MIFFQSKSLYILLFIALSYIFFNTGIHSDDWVLVEQVNNWTLFDVFFPNLSKIHVVVFGLPSYYLDYFQYYFFRYNYLYYDLVKVLINFISIYMVHKFLIRYTSFHGSLFISLLFVLFPSHDSVNYWTIALPYILIPALAMYSHFLIDTNKIKKGISIGLLGSFMGFASPPYYFGLSIIFLLTKEYKKFIIFIIPQFLYIIYYFYIANILQLSKGRIEEHIEILKFFKQFILQIGTALDTFIGPSFWLKLYYSIFNISLFSLSIGLFLIYIFYKNFKLEQIKVNKNLLISLSAIVISSFGMFALTGFYPQIAFNLGNRVTVYGSLFVSYLIVIYFIKSQKTATLIFALFVFSTLGLSDYWKELNKTQLQIIEHISNNQDLKSFNNNQQLFVSYNQYSPLGKIAHIEFFAADIANAIFKHALNKEYKTSPLNRRFYYDEKLLVDKKYDTTFEVTDHINVYDSYSDQLLTIDEHDIQKYINSLPDDNRHWVQLLKKDSIFMKILLKLMPRLEYAL